MVFRRDDRAYWLDQLEPVLEFGAARMEVAEADDSACAESVGCSPSLT